jgi:hypothetical protein
VEVETFELFGSEPFLVSLAVGAIVLGVTAVVALSMGRPAPIGGLLMSAAILATIGFEESIDRSVVLGVALLAAAGGITRRRRLPALALGILGAVMIALAAPSPPGSLSPWLVVFAVVPIGILLVDFDDHYRITAISLPLLTASYLGMLVTVPDTERAIVAVGVALPLAAAGWPLRLAHLGRAGGAASAGLFVWLAFAEGAGRPGSVVGALTALGLLVAEPTARLLRSSVTTNLGAVLGRSIGPIAVIGLQGALALYMARIAGLRQSALAALVLALPLLAIVGVWAAWPHERAVAPPPHG